MSFFRKSVEDMTAYVPGEQPRDRRHIKLNTNENPYPPSPQVIEALHGAIGDRLRLYPLPMADDVREKAGKLYRLRPENVLVGNGSDDLLAIILRACLEPGTRVAYPVPTYSLYETLIELYGGVSVRVPYGPEFALPEALVEADARVIFLANPNSPSGTSISPEEVRRLAANPDRLIVVDEAYADFADTNCLGLVRDLRNVVVLRTFSKSFALAGMRIGLAIGSRDVIATLAKVKDSYNVNRLAIVAGAAALADHRWMEGKVRRIRETRETLTTNLRALGFEVMPSQANFVLARRPGHDLEGIVHRLARRGILVRHFPTDALRDAMRITVGTDEEMETFLRVLTGLVEKAFPQEPQGE